MLMVIIVIMLVIMYEEFMFVHVQMVFRKMQPNIDGHKETGDYERSSG
jgi:hypothetical protein